MKNLLLILILNYSFLTLNCFAQQYAWQNISSKLPEFYRDTTIINGGADTIIANIHGISFIDDNHGWICTYHPFDAEPSAVLETTNGGQTWTEHSAPYAGADIYMIDEQYGYFGAINGFIYKTTDGAETWTFHGLLTVALYDLEFPPRPAQVGYAGGKDGHLSQITPQGLFPFSLGLNGSVYCLSFPTEEQGWALLDYQLIIRYVNGEWISDQSHPFSSKGWLFCIDNFQGWCVGDRFLLTNNGIDWEQVDPNFIQTGAMMGVYFTDLNNGWAVGTQGQIAYSINGGYDWTMLEHNLTDAILTGVLFTSPNNGYIIGGEKTILKYTLLSDVEEQPTQPFEFKLNQNYPNPFNPSTKISYQMPVSSNVTLKVYDVLGNEIVTLVDEYKPAGTYEVEFNGHFVEDRNLSSGVYFYQLMVGGPETSTGQGIVQTKKMILIK